MDTEIALRIMKFTVLFLMWLILTLNSACTSVPKAPEPPQAVASQQTPEPTQQEAPKDPLEVEIDAILADPNYVVKPAVLTPEDMLPDECRKAPEDKRRSCWHSFMLTAQGLGLGQTCEYSFQCYDEKLKLHCVLGADSAKPANSVCTVKYPMED